MLRDKSETMHQLRIKPSDDAVRNMPDAVPLDDQGLRWTAGMEALVRYV